MSTLFNYDTSLKSLSLIQGFIRAFSIDYRTLALFRVGIGSLIFVDLILRVQYFSAFFTDQGILPRQLVLNSWGDHAISFYLINGGSLVSSILVLISMLLAFALIIGYKTRFVTILSWFLLFSLQQGSGIVSQGGDSLLRLLLFWAIFLPLGAKFSLDSALCKNETELPKTMISLASIGLLMQVMYVYWIGALLKTGKAWNEDYTAVYYALSAEQFSTQLGQWVMINLDFLLPYVTQFVLCIEQYGPLLIFSPFLLLYLRLPILILLIGMHIGFGILLNVGLFPLISITSLLLFVPKEVWDWIATKWINKRSEGVSIYYDQECDFCLKTVNILKVMLILPKIKVIPAQQDIRYGAILEKNNSWIVEKSNGDYLLKWAALVYLFSKSLPFSWVKWILKLLNSLNMGNKIYNTIAQHRKLLSTITAIILPWHNTNWNKTTWLNHTLAAACIIMVLQINLQTVFGKDTVPNIPFGINNIKYTLGLSQKWNMFAPTPISVTRWPVIVGITNDNRSVDIFRELMVTPSHDKPENILSEYSYYRWRKYYGRIAQNKYKRYRVSYVKYECKKWNKKHAKKDQIKKIKLFMVSEKTLLDATKERQRARSLGTYSC